MSTTEQQPAAEPNLTTLILGALNAASTAGAMTGRYIYDHNTDEQALLAAKREAQDAEREAAAVLWRAVYSLGIGSAVAPR